MQDPEFSHTPKGVAVRRFSVACNRLFRQDEETQKEISCFDVSWRTRLAEVCEEYVKKVHGVGRLEQDRWMDSDGKDGEQKAEEPAAEDQVHEEASRKGDPVMRDLPERSERQRSGSGEQA